MFHQLLKRVAFIACAVLMSAQSSAAQPNARRGVMLNSAAKLCAPYYSGDECFKSEIPKGWQAATAEWQQGQSIVTFNGKSCHFKPSKEESCCAELGYAFDSTTKQVLRPSGLEKLKNSPCFQIEAEAE